MLRKILKKLLIHKKIKSLIYLIKSIIKNDFYGMAAEMGFMLVVGFFPFMLFLMAVFGWMGNKCYLDSMLRVLSNIMPVQAMNLLKSVLTETMIFDHGQLLAILGITTTIVLSTNGVAVILKGLNRAYKVEETRNFLYTRLLSFIMLIVNVLVLFLTINIIIFGKILITFAINNFGLSSGIADLILTLRWPVSFLALYLMAFLSYYILPDLKGKESFKCKSAIPGTIFFTTFWLLGSWGFSLYVNNLSTYNLVYGTIGAFFILMIWLYYTSILLLIGGEINSQEYNKLSNVSAEIRDEILDLKKLIKHKNN